MSIPGPRRLRFGALVATAVVLTGCGSVTPGAGIVVEGEQVSMAQVSETARDICVLSEEQLASSNQVVPMSVMTARAVELLTLAKAGPMIAEEYDVDVGAAYQEQVAGFERTAETLPASARDTYVELSSAITLVTEVTEEAGRLALAADGVSDPTEEDLAARGEEVLASWMEAHEVRINPRYGLDVVDGSIAAAPTDVSVAVSQAALAGQAEEVDVEAARALPESQRCG